MNWRFVGYFVSLVLLAIGFGQAVSALVGLSDPGDDVIALGICAAISLVAGSVLLVFTWSARRMYIGFREAFVSVGFSWLAAVFFGSLPYVLGGVFGPVDALFESTSGFTTTGASVLQDFSQARGIMFWRSLTHWYGGMGIIVLFLALLPAVGGGAIRLFAAEAPGPTATRLTPRLRDTAKQLWLIYVGLSALEALILLALGMGLFDAVTHTFGTMATGGFSPLAGSIGAYGRWDIELVIVVFMVIAGGNFGIYALLLFAGKKQVLKDPELQVYLGSLAVGTLVVGISLVLARTHFSFGHALRESLFQVVSLQTTTGYVTANFDEWNSFAKTLLLLLMFVGGCGGSTAGGIKVVRFLILFHTSRRLVVQSVRPTAVLPVKVGRKLLPESLVMGVLGFFFLYLTIFALATLLVSTSNTSLVTSASAVAACLNNVGPGLALVGATLNYAPLPVFAKLVLMATMLLGRLELFALLAPLSARFWHK